MPIFTQVLQLKDDELNDPRKALKAMSRHIQYLQNQLEYTLMNLDSTNITEIETDKTDITSSSGAVNMTGERIEMKGVNGESFTAGKSASGKFVFAVNGKNGLQSLYLSDDGEIVITKNSKIIIDCGEW